MLAQPMEILTDPSESPANKTMRTKRMMGTTKKSTKTMRVKMRTTMIEIDKYINNSSELRKSFKELVYFPQLFFALLHLIPVLH